MLKKFLNAKPEVKSALIFVNDPHRVEIVYEKLLEMGFIAAPLHGDTSKDDRKVRATAYVSCVHLLIRYSTHLLL
jgi:superfamily II DNA/RNA helicase